MTQLGFYERQESTRSTKIFDRMCWHRAYFLSYRKPNYPMPAICYQVAYQIGDGDYWCGVYDIHLEQSGSMDCFTMLWNARDNPEYMRANRSHLFGVM